MQKTMFIKEGSFFKGNIHSHSTISDGRLPRDTVVEAYRNRGYNFLVMADHDQFFDDTHWNNENFITIPGAEVWPMTEHNDKYIYHMVIIPGSDELIAAATKPKFRHGDNLESKKIHQNYQEIQAFIDDLRSHGYQVLLAHPYLSHIEYDQILPLENLTSVEVYNHSAHVHWNMGESNVCYDALLRNGKRLWCTAVDDCHNPFPYDSEMNDSFGGFIVVKAPSLSERDICNSITAGSFYSSQGPEIYDFYVEDDTAYFSCSPCKRVYINGDFLSGRVQIAEKGEPLLTHFESKLFGNEKYVRIECYDVDGKKAYTNPIWLV